MSKKKDRLKVLFFRLESLTSPMEVPVYRRRNVAWLSKNLVVKNKDHPHFNEAMSVVLELLANGVSHG